MFNHKRLDRPSSFIVRDSDWRDHDTNSPNQPVRFVQSGRKRSGAGPTRTSHRRCYTRPRFSRRFHAPLADSQRSSPPMAVACWPTMTRRNASCAYTQIQMNVGSVGAVAGILIVILAAVYIWLVRSGHGD